MTRRKVIPEPDLNIGPGPSPGTESMLSGYVYDDLKKLISNDAALCDILNTPTRVDQYIKFRKCTSCSGTCTSNCTGACINRCGGNCVSRCLATCADFCSSSCSNYNN